MKNKAKYLAICAIFDRDQVFRRRFHAGIQSRVKALMSGVNNHCDLTLTTWRGACHIWPAEAIITDTEGTPELHSLKITLLLSLKPF